MLIEQFIEVEFGGGAGHLVAHVLLKLIIFMTKISNESLRLKYCLLQNIV